MAATCASYFPNEAETQQFWERELQREKSILDVPAGFPKRLSAPQVWTADEIVTQKDKWIVSLSEGEVTSIDAALSAFEAEHDDLSKISTRTFNLPLALAQRLKGFSDRLYNGIGFFILRGLDPSKYTPKQNVVINVGVSAHICPQRGFIDAQIDGPGKRTLAHIVNVQATSTGPKTVAPAYSNIPLSFHTDNCEIMTFYFLDVALTGGETVLTSSWQLYNELAKYRPEVLHTLADPWVLDSLKDYDIKRPRTTRPLQRTGGRVPILFRFSRYPVLGWQRRRNPDLVKPTEAQLAAADAVQFMAMKNAVTLPVRRGDMLFANDMTIMHARTSFDDGGIPEKRHLLKMYLRDPDAGWTVPEEVQCEWHGVYGPNRPDGSKEEVWDVIHKAGVEEFSMLNG